MTNPYRANRRSSMLTTPNVAAMKLYTHRSYIHVQDFPFVSTSLAVQLKIFLSRESVSSDAACSLG